jgi:hypothetical protein
MSAATNRLKCGDFGGRTKDGQPCKVAAADGPCTRHAAQMTREAMKDLVDTDFKFSVHPFERLHDKVCIVGFTDHRTEALEAPYNDGTWELWGLNELYRYMPVEKFHRWFEIHGRAYLEKDDDGKKHMKDLGTAFTIPVYMQQRWDDIPASVMFPKDELVQRLGSSYWTNCPAWMIGMAIAMGYKAIHMVGVDMAQDSEYAEQRPCCEHWLGVAKGMGVDIKVPDTSDLLACVGLYGYEDSGSKLARKLQERLTWLHAQDNHRLEQIRKIGAQYSQKHNELAEQAAQCRGRLAELATQKKTEKQKARVAEVQEELAKIDQTTLALKAEFEQKNTALTAERNQLVGGIQDCSYILRSWMVRTEDGSPGLPDRSQDPRTGIVSMEPSGDDSQPIPTEPVAVPAGA